MAEDTAGFDLHEDTDPELFTHTMASVVVKNTEITQQQLKSALVKWRDAFFAGGAQTLADVLVEMGALKRVKVPMLMKATHYALARREDKVFGKRAYRRGLITKTQLDESLAFQKQLFKALHEVKRVETILIDDGFLRKEDAQKIWDEFSEYKTARRAGTKPATVGRAARSAGVALDPEAADDDDDAPAAPAAGGSAGAAGESGGGSALDLESLKQEQVVAAANEAGAEAPGAGAAASSGTGTGTGDTDDDPGALMSEFYPEGGGGDDIVQQRPSLTEEREEWKRKKREEAARLAKEEAAAQANESDDDGDDDEFSDDNMNSALDDSLNEIDLSNELSDAGSPPAPDKPDTGDVN